MTKTNDKLLHLDDVPVGATALSMATHRLSRLLRSNLAELLMEHGQIGLPAWRIYTGLAEFGSATQKQLVQFTHIEQSLVSRALAQLEKQGDIISRRCDVDKRARRFEFTEKGRQQFEQLLPMAQALSQQINSALTEEEFELYLDMAERIGRAAVDFKT